MDSTREVNERKQEILKDYPRMTRQDTFQFACHSGLNCYNKCCGDVNIVLTPYDIIRMRKALEMTSEEFLAKYTFVPFNKEQQLPVVMLKMNEDEARTCPFVREEGCMIYGDRPWACRMYPVGMASPGKGSAEGDEEFYFLMKDLPCEGFEESSEWTIESWMEDQGVGAYNEMGELFKQVSLHPRLLGGMELTPSKVEMFYIACYDADKFRRFIFETKLLDNFEVEPQVLEAIEKDDIELFKFGIRWLKFSVFGEQTMQLKQETIDLRKVAKSPKSSG